MSGSRENLIQWFVVSLCLSICSWGLYVASAHVRQWAARPAHVPAHLPAGVKELNLSDLSASCPKRVGDCTFSGPLASIGLGVACWGWRGNVSCLEGSCVCADWGCATSDGHCLGEEAWDAAFLSRGFRLRNGKYHLMFNASRRAWGLSKEVTARGDPLYLFQLPVSGQSPRVLLGPDHDVTMSMGALADEFELISGSDCFPGKDADVRSGTNIDDFKRTCLELGCPAFVVTQWRIFGILQGKAFFRPSSMSWWECKMSAQRDEYAADNTWSGVTIDLFVHRGLAQHFGPAMTSQLDTRASQHRGLRVEPQEGSSVAIFADGRSGKSGWCLQIVEGSIRPLQWVPPPCDSSWTLEPHLPVNRLQPHMAEAWPLKVSFSAAADDDLSCKEKQAIGPDSLMTVGPLAVFAYTKTVTFSWLSQVDFSFMQGTSLLSVIPVVGDVVMGLLRVVVLIFYLLIALMIILVGSMLSLIAVPLSFALMPIMLKLHWNHIDRAILFCVADTPFTFASLPMYALFIASDVYSLTCGWKGYEPPEKEESGVFNWLSTGITRQDMTVEGAWRAKQIRDAFVDSAALLGAFGVFPPVFVAIYFFTTVSSWLQAILLATGRITFIQSMYMGLLSEDVLQFMLTLWAFNYEKPDEYMAYASLQALIACIKEVRLLADYRRHGDYVLPSDEHLSL